MEIDCRDRLVRTRQKDGSGRGSCGSAHRPASYRSAAPVVHVAGAVHGSAAASETASETASATARQRPPLRKKPAMQGDAAMAEEPAMSPAVSHAIRSDAYFGASESAGMTPRRCEWARRSAIANASDPWQ